MSNSTMTDSKGIWIKTGYETFALSGQSGLKIEPLARKVGKNKSLFYHYFADLELYVDELQKYPIEQSYIIAEKEQNAKNIDSNGLIVRRIVNLLWQFGHNPAEIAGTAESILAEIDSRSRKRVEIPDLPALRILRGEERIVYRSLHDVTVTEISLPAHQAFQPSHQISRNARVADHSGTILCVREPLSVRRRTDNIETSTSTQRLMAHIFRTNRYSVPDYTRFDDLAEGSARNPRAL